MDWGRLCSLLFEYSLFSCFKQVSNGSLRIYKGYSLSKKAEEYLASHGLKGATYSISAADANEGLFGSIVACPYQVREP